MYCLEAVHLVEPADYGVCVVRIDFNPVAAPSSLFGCDQGRTATGEGVENDSPALGAIQNRVGNQRQGFDRRVHGKFGITVAAKGVRPWVIPDVWSSVSLTTTPRMA